ncbi:ATP-dependent nuclease [Lawsonibacter sp. JLR.KK007]|uniref:ATP-dependent nuclease n=1 Tax=Lawsonibacter sp. JLR.KK007 TaxID=3114293 RepID=UPI002FEFB0EE
MNYIKSLYIEGFKKFTSLYVQFNEHMNILVGENEVGKSTILDAIKTVLNQQYRNADKSVLRDLFNTQMVAMFQAAPSVKTLPQIFIEIELVLDPQQKSADYFYGEVYGQRKQQVEKFGIRFECKYDEELGAGMEQSILEGKIPYEYYSLTWMTFANRPYQMIKRPLNFLSIDTTNSASAPSFNYYNRTLFTSRYDEATRAKAKNEFRAKLEDALEAANLPPISENRRFGVDSKKVVLEAILSVYEDSVALENRGSGIESLIKTQIALDRANGLDVILMEEPENHLSFSTLQKMLQEISVQQDNSQIIVATHNNMIASRLNLNNVLWITEEGVKTLASVDKEVADFFVCADDNAFLQLVLSKKVFLVEGATEFLLLPKFYEQITGHTIEEDGISVISCNGISYKRYLEIAKATDKRIAVVTDNDAKSERITEADSFNSSHDLQHIFMGATTDDWTWEICVYNVNKTVLDGMIEVQTGAKYLFHEKDYGAVPGKMLNNKVDVAYQMLTSGITFEAPQYIKDAIGWLRK